MDLHQNMARGIVFFQKTHFRGHFPRRIHLTPPSRIFYNYCIFNILQSFYHLSFLPDSRGKTRTTVSPSVRRLAPSAPLPTRKIRTRITPVSRGRVPWCGPVAVGRDVPIAPPRHRRGARLGIEHTLRVLHAAALSAARCAAGPRTRRDVIIASPLRTQYSHGALPGRCDGRPPGLPARALPPVHTREVHPTPKNRLRWLIAFALLYIPPRRSLCPFVLKHRARRHATAAVRGMASLPLASPPSCGMAVGRDVGGRASRLAPYRQYQR